jgi:hypothetical protein
MLYLLYLVSIPIAIMCEIAVVNKLAIDKEIQCIREMNVILSTIGDDDE